MLIFAIFRIRHIVKTQSENNFVVRESIIVLHTVLFVSTIVFQLIFMAVDNGFGRRYFPDKDPKSGYRHEFVFYVFELAN